MNLKQIEMVGFKSFADPIKLVFNEGITAIVGPNGCGKSNVADAIRWVLGEQSSKMLRGSEMQDVIFKGTEKRKSLSFCEVSLCFDNSNRVFKIDYDELVITRKLYRSGESEYMINKTPCRLKDIVEVLHDSGIGKSGYSIIGQGKVEEIISSKPEDRRAIFEEAAGIAKFKAKKTEAERKLERTQDNLTRINDIISEIDRQLAPLKKQSETAKIYLDLKEKLKLLEVNAYIYQYDYAASNKEAIQTKIDAIVEEMNLRQRDLDATIEDYNFTYGKINGLDDNISTLRDKILDLTVSFEKQTGENNLVREKYRNLESEASRIGDELSEVNNKQSELNNNLYDVNTKLNAKQVYLVEQKHELSQTEEKYQAIFSQLEEGENETKEAQKKLFESLNKLGDVKAQEGALNAEKLSYEDSIKNLSSLLVGLDDKIKNNKSEWDSHSITANLLKVRKQELDQNLSDLISEQNTKNSNLKDLEGKLNSINSNLLSMQNRKKLLEDMQREFEGFNGSVKRLLTDAEKNRQLKEKIVGVLANLIKVPATYQTAIEMALGSAVQNIVTNTDDDAKMLIEYLKKMEYGRITFLPINAVKPRFFDRNNERFVTYPGSFGLASDLITYDKNLNNIISSLLGTTMVVNNIETAKNMAQDSRYAFRIVTLDGDIISPQGSITGGSKKLQVANLLSRENNIELTIREIENLNREKTEKTNQYNQLFSEIQKLVKQVEDVSGDLKDLEIALAKENEICTRYSMIASDLDAEQNRLNLELSKSQQMISSIQNKLANLGSENEYNLQDALNVNDQEFSELKNKREQLNTKITSLKVEIASIESEIVSLNQEKDRLTSELEANNIKVKDLTTSLENISAQLNASRLTIQNSQIVLESQETERQLQSLKDEVSKQGELKLELQSKLRLLEEQRMNLSAEVNRLQDKKYQQDLNLTKVDTDIESMQERVWTEYELTYSTALDCKQEMFNLKDAMPEISRIKKEISKLGNVNVNAIEDYKLLLERHGSMYDQAQDLIKAENDLKQIIKELSNEMVERFETEFKKINENFGRTFQTLFGGGRARLELVQSDDILTAGVDIIAEPPGKKLSNITLLSGGEKALTAIAILFAILQLKPMPFCLLDEIEAALDEANVERFAKYLKNYSSDTQFIVITHKKPTMEHANVLYGVTMEEKGVSKIVSVKLSEAIRSVEK